MKLICFKKEFWRTSWLDSIPAWFLYVGVLSLVAYALTGMTFDDIGHSSESVVVFSGFVAWLIYSRNLRKSSLLWLLLASVIIPLISWAAAHGHHPQWAESSPKIHRLTHWFTFIPIAFWLGGRTKNVFFIWSLALFGIFLAPWLTGGGWSEWKLGLMGQRIDFGLHNAQHAAMLYATGGLGLICFSRRIFASDNKGYWFKRFFWLLALIICCFGALVTQTRGIWLGMCGSGLFLVVFCFFLSWRRSQKKYFSIIIVFLVVVLLTVTLLETPLKKKIENRLSVENTEISMIFEGTVADIPYSSVGVRIHTWIEAWSWIKQRPLVGWGGSGRKLVFEQSTNLPESLKKSFRHLHNSYLDLLVNFGLLGGGLLLSLLVWLIAKGTYAWRSGHLPGDVLIFFLSFLVFWLIVNCFESYMFFSSGSFVFALICGGVLTHIWKYDTEKIKI